jgi:hypothetical protein
MHWPRGNALVIYSVSARFVSWSGHRVGHDGFVQNLFQSVIRSPDDRCIGRCRKHPTKRSVSLAAYPSRDFCELQHESLCWQWVRQQPLKRFLFVASELCCHIQNIGILNTPYTFKFETRRISFHWVLHRCTTSCVKHSRSYAHAPCLLQS